MIFISHSTKDDHFVNRLRDNLIRLGYKVWVDHHDIPAGLHWGDVVEEKLKMSKILLLVLSPDSIESRNVKVEWREFYRQEKKIIPIMRKKCPVPLLIRDLTYVDFSDDAEYDKSFSKLGISLPPPSMNTRITPDEVQERVRLDREFARLKQELESLRLDLDTLVGKNQLLLVISDVWKNLRADLDREKLFVGWQHNEADVKPDIDLRRYDAYENGVSRQHAMFSVENDKLTITDLGSTNGTKVDREVLEPHRPYPLHNKSIIELGSMSMRCFFNLMV